MEKIFSPPAMRGIKQALREVREADPSTALTERALRRMVSSGELPSIRVGSKYLINLQILFSYLSQGAISATEEMQTPAIRRVGE